MQFSYQAREASGQIRSGEINAENSDAAAQQLRRDGLYLLSIQETSAGSQGQMALFQKRITRSEIIYATTQLAVMVDSGIPLAEAVSGLAQQTENPTFRNILSRIHRDLEGGEDFSVALSRYPKQFDRTFVNLVKASEASGSLGPMLDRIATQTQNEQETRQKVKGAMMYPAVMLVMCVGVCIFLLTYVFPKLMPMFNGRENDIPGPTKFMIVVSNALTQHWMLIGTIMLLVVGLVIYALRQSWGKRIMDWVWLNMPVWGTLTRKVAISRCLRTLSSTVNAGVPMLESLELCSGVANNIYYEACWLDVSEKVATGKQIHEALSGNSLFPETLVQMIASGETTGRLGSVLEKLADYFDREVANAIKTATSLAEPIMVAVMGTVIGTIALAMLLPIFKLSSGA